MKRVFQDKFGPQEGNCFAACLASLLEVSLESIDFNAGGDDWLELTNEKLKPFGYRWLEINIDYVAPKYNVYHLRGQLCVFAGKSPRFDCNHAVVGRVDVSSDGYPTFELIHDPMPGGKGIVGLPKQLGFFIPIDPARL